MATVHVMVKCRETPPLPNMDNRFSVSVPMLRVPNPNEVIFYGDKVYVVENIGWHITNVGRLGDQVGLPIAYVRYVREVNDDD